MDTDEALAARGRLLAHTDELADLLPHGALAPEDLWPGRGVAMLLGTLTRLGVSGDWVALAQGALRDGWDAA